MKISSALIAPITAVIMASLFLLQAYMHHYVYAELKDMGEFRWLPLAMEEMVAWVPAEHPLAKRAVFPLSAFASEPYIDICRPSETDCSITFEKFGIHPNTRFSATDPYSAYLMVEAGLGISLNQRMTAADWNGKVAIMSLDPPQPVEVGLAIPETMSPAAAKFADFAEARAGRH